MMWDLSFYATTHKQNKPLQYFYIQVYALSNNFLRFIINKQRIL